MLDSITGYRRMNVPVLPAPKTASAYKVITSKARTPVTFQPFGIVDMHKGNNGKYVSRLYYDSTGRIFKEISNGGHGEKVYNGYGKNGEHAHDWVWKDGAVVSRKARELTPRERKECEDILNQK